jgi:hypothetical protein
MIIGAGSRLTVSNTIDAAVTRWLGEASDGSRTGHRLGALLEELEIGAEMKATRHPWWTRGSFKRGHLQTTR